MLKETSRFFEKVIDPARKYLEQRAARKKQNEQAANLAQFQKRKEEKYEAVVKAMHDRVLAKENAVKLRLTKPKLNDRFSTDNNERGPIAALQNTYDINYGKVMDRYNELLAQARFKAKQEIVGDRSLTTQEKDRMIAELYLPNRTFSLSEADAYSFNEMVEKLDEQYEMVLYAKGVMQMLDSMTLADVANISVEGAKSVINSLLQLKDVNKRQVYIWIKVLLIAALGGANAMINVACSDAPPTTTIGVTTEDDNSQEAEQTQTGVVADETAVTEPEPVAAPASETVESPRITVSPELLTIAQSLDPEITPEASETDLNRVFLEATIEAARDAGIPPELTPTSVKIHPGEQEGTIEIEGYTEQKGEKVLVIEKVFNSNQTAGPTEWRVVDYDTSALPPIVDDEYFDYDSGTPLPEMKNENTQLVYEGGNEGYLAVTVTNEDGSTNEVKIRVEIPAGTTLINQNGDAVDLNLLDAKTVSSYGTTDRTHVQFYLDNENNAMGWFNLETGEFQVKYEMLWTRPAEEELDNYEGLGLVRVTPMPGMITFDSTVTFDARAEMIRKEHYLPTPTEKLSVSYVQILPEGTTYPSSISTLFQYSENDKIWISVAGYRDFSPTITSPSGQYTLNNEYQGILITEEEESDLPNVLFSGTHDTRVVLNETTQKEETVPAVETNEEIISAIIESEFVRITLPRYVGKQFAHTLFFYALNPTLRHNALTDKGLTEVNAWIDNLANGNPQTDTPHSSYNMMIIKQ